MKKISISFALVVTISISFIHLFSSCENSLFNRLKYDLTVRTSDDNEKGDTVKVYFNYNILSEGYKFDEIEFIDLGQDKQGDYNLFFELLFKGGDEGVYPFESSATWSYIAPEIGNYNIKVLTDNGDTIVRTFDVDYESFELEMDSIEYKIIVDSVKNTPELSYMVDSYGTAEYYYGASYYYKHFNLRIDRRIQYGQPEFENYTEIEARKLMMDRIEESILIVLQESFPKAEPFQKFYVTFQTYNNDYTRSNCTLFYLYSNLNGNWDFEFQNEEFSN